MRNILKKISLFGAALLCSGMIIGSSLTTPVWANPDPNQTTTTTTTTSGNNSNTAPADCTSILPNAWCNNENSITNIIKAVIAILSGGVGVLAVLGLVICGFIWMTARDNEAQVTMAKKRMLDIVIGLGIWALVAAGTTLVLNLVTPGAEDAKKEVSILEMGEKDV